MVITRLAVVIVASVPQRVRLSQGGVAGYLGYVTPSVVVIVCNYGAIFIGYCDYIVLNILYVVIFFAVINETESVAVIIIHKDKRFVARLLTCQYTSVIEIFGLYAVYGFAYSVAVGIVSVNICVIAVGYTLKLPAAPLKRLTAESEGIADFVIGHSLTVKAC